MASILAHAHSDKDLHMKIISGGQTGADLGALMAAKDCGLQTGGMAPKGYITENGPNLDLRDKFGLIESESTNYVVRTRHNQLTYNSCVRYDKPVCLILKDELYGDLFKSIKTALITRIKKEEPNIINVAGNRESVCPGIQEDSYNFLVAVFKDLAQLSLAQEDK